MSQVKRPCGRRFCPAAIRMLHPITEMTFSQIGAALGISRDSVGRHAVLLDLPSRYEGFHKPVSIAKLRHLYVDENLSRDDIAAVVGCHPDTVWRKARAMGLRRKAGHKFARWIKWPADFNEMWTSNVLMADILRAATTTFKDVRCVSREARRRGLPIRPKSASWSMISMAEYRQIKMRADMARTAAIEQRAFINADLVDGLNLPGMFGPHVVGSKHAALVGARA